MAAARAALPEWREVSVPDRARILKTVTSRHFSSGQASGQYFVES